MYKVIQIQEGKWQKMPGSYASLEHAAICVDRMQKDFFKESGHEDYWEWLNQEPLVIVDNRGGSWIVDPCGHVHATPVDGE